MMKALPNLLLVLLLPLAVVWGFAGTAHAQVGIHCGKINQTIPRFAHSSNFKDELLLVRQKVLEPIEKSNTTFEIRFFLKHHAFNSTVVIACKGDTIDATYYETALSYAADTVDESGWRNIGPLATNPKVFIMFKKFPGRQLRLQASWNELIRDLIGHHLFDLPTQELLDADLSKKYGANYKAPGEPFQAVIEIKVGHQLRRTQYTENYWGDANTNKSVQDRNFIIQQLSQFLTNKQ